MTNIDKQKLLAQIAADIKANNVCDHLAKTAKNLVIGEGNLNAEVVFIGEAPGKNEDELGRPFVGAAGKFLDEMLGHAGLKREDVYITNIVKYRPPNNRDPEPAEKEAFWPYLLRQLKVIQPKLIVTLGRHSMEYFLPSQRISLVHGKPLRLRVWTGQPGADASQGGGEHRSEAYQEYAEREAQAPTRRGAAKLVGASGSAGAQNQLAWVILPLFHPAAALYNGGMRQTLIDDFMKIPIVLKKLKKG